MSTKKRSAPPTTNASSSIGSPAYVAVYVEPGCADDGILSLTIRRLAWVVYDRRQNVVAEESHASRDGVSPVGRLPPAFVRAVQLLPPEGYVAAHDMIGAHLLLRRKFRECGMGAAWERANKCCTRSPELLRVAREDRAIGEGGLELGTVYDLLTKSERGSSAAVAAAGKVDDCDRDADDALSLARKTGRIFFFYKNSPKHRHQCLARLFEDCFPGGCRRLRGKRARRDWDNDGNNNEDENPAEEKRQFKHTPDEIPDDEMRRMTVKTASRKLREKVEVAVASSEVMGR